MAHAARPLADRTRFSRSEGGCLALVALAIVVAIAAPPIAQDAAYHAFADQRAILGVPRGADVLSSLAFLAVALAAIARLASPARPRFSRSTEASLWMLATGLALTAVGSAAYHLDPRDATLAWDRMPMTIAFAGVFGIAVSQRVSGRIAGWTMPLVALLGVASVFYWRASGNLAPYVVLQFGGALALVVFAMLVPRRSDPFPWWWVIGWYAIAKAFESADAAVFAMTGGHVAGHAIKHLAAAAAGAAAMMPLWRARERTLSRPT